MMELLKLTAIAFIGLVIWLAIDVWVNREEG